jgi:hypothetical protein
MGKQSPKGKKKGQTGSGIELACAPHGHEFKSETNLRDGGHSGGWAAAAASLLPVEMDAGRPTIFPRHRGRAWRNARKRRERDWMQVAHDVPVQFSSSVKMYSAKDVSAKVNSTHHGTIYTVG